MSTPRNQLHADAQWVAESLEGTCNSLDKVVGERMGVGKSIPDRFYTYLDELVSQCGCCDIWHHKEEINSDGFCGSCEEYLEENSDVSDT